MEGEPTLITYEFLNQRFIILLVTLAQILDYRNSLNILSHLQWR